MAKKHLDILLDSNTIGAAHANVLNASELLERINHPMASEVAALANKLLTQGVEHVSPLAQYLNGLPLDADL